MDMLQAPKRGLSNLVSAVERAEGDIRDHGHPGDRYARRQEDDLLGLRDTAPF